MNVQGLIDDDVLETASIEATSVYVERIGTLLYSTGLDREDPFVSVTMPVVVGRSVLQGRVTAVSDDEFTLSTGVREITVEVEQMPYDPLDSEGYQRIEVGDVVSVGGHVDVDLFEGADFVAETIVEIDD